MDDEGAETSVSQMSFPDLGDASIAYEISVSAEDVPFTLTGAFAMIAVDDRITVLFDEVGYKTLALSAVVGNDLLRTRP